MLRTRDTFLAILGHDLRTPLSTMALSGELLTRPGLGDARTREAGARVRRSAAVMSSMVVDLLEYSRAGRSHGQIQQVDSRRLVHGIVELLDVPPALIEAHGAVSEPVARLMAESVRRLLGAECGVAITGVAGPGGGSEAKPVGTATEDETVTRTRLFHFSGDRTAVRERAAQAALHLLLGLLDDLLTPGAGPTGDVGG